MTVEQGCRGGNHVTAAGAMSCACGDITRVPAVPVEDESLAERSQRTGECICTTTERMRNRPFPECGGHEPPAGTQQDDELRDQVADWLIHNLFWGVAWGKQHEAADRLLRDVPTLAARPSADTDMQLASVLRKLIADKHAFLSLSTHRRESGMPVQFTLDDTTVGLTDAEADAIKTEAGW